MTCCVCGGEIHPGVGRLTVGEHSRHAFFQDCFDARRNPLQAEVERLRKENAELRVRVDTLADALLTPRPYSEYHEDFGAVLWWLMPIDEPPYVGAPDCSDWPFGPEHEKRLWWTPLPDCNAIQRRWEECRKS